MSPLLVAGLLLGADPAPPVVEAALTTELDRAMTGLRLPDSAPPYLIQYDVLDGEVTSTFAELGAVVSADTQRYRNLRVEVRVGDYTRDSSNFQAFGEPSGVTSRQLPLEDDVTAIRREAWSATDDAYKDAVQQLSRKLAALSGDPTPRPPDYEQRPPVKVSYAEGAPEVGHADAAKVQALVTDLSAALRGYPSIEVGQAVGRDWQGRRLTLTSEGTRVWRSTGYTVIRVEGTARLADGSTVEDSRSWLARTPAELPPEAEMLAAVRAMADTLSALPKAPTESDYLGPVIFEGGASTELFSQLLAAELVGTPPALDDSDSEGIIAHPPSARLGRRVLPLGWSVVDDARLPSRAMGAYASDMEGVAPSRVELVKDGVVRDVLMSRIPSHDRTASTGHARSLGSDRRSAMPANVTVTANRLVSIRKLERAGVRLAAQTGHDYVLVVKALQPPALSEGVEITFTGESPLAGLTHPYEVERLYADGHRELVRSGEFSGVDRRVLRDIVAASAGAGPVDMLDGPPGPGRYGIGNTGGLPCTWNVPAVLIGEMELAAKGGSTEPRVLTIPTVPAK